MFNSKRTGYIHDCSFVTRKLIGQNMDSMKCGTVSQLVETLLLASHRICNTRFQISVANMFFNRLSIDLHKTLHVRRNAVKAINKVRITTSVRRVSKVKQLQATKQHQISLLYLNTFILFYGNEMAVSENVNINMQKNKRTSRLIS